MNMPKNVDEIRKESMEAAMKSFGAMSKCFQAFAVEPHGGWGKAHGRKILGKGVRGAKRICEDSV
jgi:hypothetical protein